MSEGMKTSTRWMVAGGALAALALLAWALAPRALEVDVATVTEGPFEQSIGEDGKTRLADRFMVSAPLAGRLSRITLREGDSVVAGAVLGSLSPLLSPLLDERALKQQTAHVESTQAMVRRAATRIDSARLGIARVNVELRRNEQLVKDGFITPSRMETDRLAERAAHKEVEAAVEEHHMAEHDMEQARAALDVLRQPGSAASGRAFELRAPVAGKVLRVLQPSEATVALGTPVMELGDLGRLEVVAQLLSADAMQTPPGTRVRIEQWGGTGVLAGSVRRVEPSAITKVSALGVEEQRVNVLIDITSPPAQWLNLGDGFRVEVRLVVLQTDKAMQVPVSGVFPWPGGQPGEMAVFLLDGRKVKQVPVVLRARNATNAWVTQGLKAGERVVVYPPTALKDGARVKARRGSN